MQEHRFLAWWLVDGAGRGVTINSVGDLTKKDVEVNTDNPDATILGLQNDGSPPKPLMEY